MELSFLELLAVLVYGLGLTCGLHALLTKTRNSTSAVAWLLICFALPLVGTLLYVTVGQERLHRRRTFNLRMSAAVFRARMQGLHTAGDGPCGLESAPHRQLVERLLGVPLIAGNQVEILIDGEQANPALLAAAEAAESSINVQFYIFDEDQVGGRFRDVLIKKALAGVDVRVLYDAVGSHGSSRGFWKGMEQAGVKVHPFMPLSLPRHRWQINLRNHRKLVVVDGKVGFTGSMNMGSRHMVTQGGKSHDITFSLAGPVIPYLLRSFASDWYFACDEDLSGHSMFQGAEPVGDMVIATVESGPDKDHGDIHQLLVTGIHRASRSVVLVTPYFIPDAGLSAAIISAAMRGCEVTLVVPGRTDSKLINWARPNYLQPLLRAGAKVYERPGPLLHMKLTIIDGDLSIVGSTNLDNRSFFLNFELDLVIPGTTMAARLQEVVAAEIAAAHPVSVLRDLNPALPRRLLTRVASLFSPIL